MKALYRRYRPRTLQEVVGQERITQALQKSIDNNRISHAYLFIGPRGTGKTSVARIFAHTINNFEYELEDNYIDIIEIDAASNRGIDNVRELREKANLAPVQGKYKVYIIDEVHMLTTEAFNALLKTLEEPPEHIVFIMATTDAHKVPITISSRSQTHVFQLADQKTMTDYLRQLCKKEKIKITDDALDLLYKHGGGSFRDTLSLLDQISTLKSSGKITRQDIIDALGLPDDALIEQLLDNYHAQDINAIRSTLEQLYGTGINTAAISSALVDLIVANSNTSDFPLLNRLIEQSKPSLPYPEVRLLLTLTKFQPIKTENVVSHVQTTQIKSTTPDTAAIQSETIIQETVSEVSTQAVTELPQSAVDKPIDHTPHGEGVNDNWQKILSAVTEQADSILNLLNDSQYIDDGKILTIFTGKSFKQKQVEKKRDVILSVLPKDYELVVSAQNKPSSVADTIKNLMGGGEIVKL